MFTTILGSKSNYNPRAGGKVICAVPDTCQEFDPPQEKLRPHHNTSELVLLLFFLIGENP